MEAHLFDFIRTINFCLIGGKNSNRELYKKMTHIQGSLSVRNRDVHSHTGEGQRALRISSTLASHIHLTHHLQFLVLFPFFVVVFISL